MITAETSYRNYTIRPASRAYAIEQIQDIAENNHTDTLSDKMVLDDIWPLTEAYLCREFGSVKNAIRAAKLYPSRPEKTDLVRSLIEFKIKYSRSPKVIDAQGGLLPYSVQPYLTAFGTWNNALAAAGLKSNREASGGKNSAILYGDEEIKFMILTLQMAYGETGILPPRRVHDSTNPPYTARQLRRIGNWGQVAEAAHLRLGKISAVHTKSLAEPPL